MRFNASLLKTVRASWGFLFSPSYSCDVETQIFPGKTLRKCFPWACKRVGVPPDIKAWQSTSDLIRIETEFRQQPLKVNRYDQFITQFNSLQLLKIVHTRRSQVRIWHCLKKFFFHYTNATDYCRIRSGLRLAYRSFKICHYSFQFLNH